MLLPLASVVLILISVVVVPHAACKPNSPEPGFPEVDVESYVLTNKPPSAPLAPVVPVIPCIPCVPYIP